tara:strand:+ start:407 stop:1315 length:909 start_codon:yes stop_codon:yes gene_type:complete
MADAPAAAPEPTPAPAPAPEAASPAADPPPATAPPAAAPAAGAVDDHWLGGVEEGDLRTWAESKGMQNASLTDVLESYHNLEKVVGADKAGRTVTLLGDDATPEQAGEFYTKLGRPADAAGYGFVAPEGEDGAFADWAGKTFFDAGLTGKQAAYLAEQWEGFVAANTEATTTAATVARNDAEAALKTEWGAAYDNKVKGIDKAAVALGITKENLNGLRTAMGPVAAMKFIDSLNSKIGEHEFTAGDSVNTGVLTPAQAKLKLGELTMNKEFMDAWTDKQHPGHAAALEKKAALSRLITGEAA